MCQSEDSHSKVKPVQSEINLWNNIIFYIPVEHRYTCIWDCLCITVVCCIVHCVSKYNLKVYLFFFNGYIRFGFVKRVYWTKFCLGLVCLECLSDWYPHSIIVSLWWLLLIICKAKACLTNNEAFLILIQQMF